MGMAIDLIVISMFLAVITGYCLNIYRLCKCRGAFTGFDALRVAGVFIFPIGSIVGYIK